MNKKEYLIRKVAKEAGISQSEAEKAVNIVFEFFGLNSPSRAGTAKQNSALGKKRFRSRFKTATRYGCGGETGGGGPGIFPWRKK